MSTSNWQCPRCGCDDYEVDEIRTVGGAISKILDIQNKKFSAVSCERCRYTEFYKTETSMLGNVFDFFVS